MLTCLLMSLIGCDLLNWLGSAEATPFVPSKEMILQNAMQQMLHIHPSRIKHVQNNSDSAPPPPPQYMMQLYQKYTSSESMKSRSNTIRSIIPLRGNFAIEKTPGRSLTCRAGRWERTSRRPDGALYLLLPLGGSRL